jgi:hypothetical protein
MGCDAIHDENDTPCTSFIVKYGTPGGSMESSCTGTMLGCSSCPVICASAMEP